jgi:hypothetical protein
VRLDINLEILVAVVVYFVKRKKMFFSLFRVDFVVVVVSNGKWENNLLSSLSTDCKSGAQTLLSSQQKKTSCECNFVCSHSKEKEKHLTVM